MSRSNGNSSVGSPIDPLVAASNLELHGDGVWVARNSSEISYPSEGNSACFAVEDNSFWFRHRNKCLIEVIGRFPPRGALFDIGGGNGVVSKALHENGIDVVLVEPGLDGIRNAKLRGIPTLVHATLEDAGFLPGTLPGAGLFDVLEHIEDDRKFLRDLHSYLTSDGRIYLAVPAFTFLWSDEDDLAGHFRRYTLGGLCDRLTEAGFEIEFATYFFSVLPLPIFLFRSIPSRLGRRTHGDDVTRAEHSGDQGMLSGLVDRALAAEFNRIRSGRRLPFGGSCLVVARRK